MGFFNLSSSKVAVFTNDEVYTYNDLKNLPFNSEEKNIILILCENTIDIISEYVTAMNSEHAVMLLSKELSFELLKITVDKYKPKWIVGLNEFDGYITVGKRLVREKNIPIEIHPNLALLLSTSGTTGSQKFVRLSYDNLKSNAFSIQQYLNINSEDRAMVNLPISYSYGMSLVNSHLLTGASIVITNESVMEKTFWDLMKKRNVTSFAGVPFTYQILQRIGFVNMNLPDLKTLTQAGGRLSEKLVKYFAEYAKKKNKKFYVMYGQTEASPRISFIPHDQVKNKYNSIGIAIPGGKLEIKNEELVYFGANVMLGYADCLKDLKKGDELQGVLYTGDTAEVDEDGYFTITGRLKRFIKLFGLRINLDEVERKLEQQVSTAIACTGNDDRLIVAIEDDQYLNEVSEFLREIYHLHKSSYKVKILTLPRFTNGKIDYVKLKEMCL
ncbi:phosphatase [Kurthia zopfii]|uniref:Acyl-CoA synthetase (AMP-forming)/AMP-acid ligase II n=2 Tax=Kurthia zopfii TaxID=1650 RepID=A0A8B4Q4N3_9BACL|nr:AMP-binding protein [Kurthia zopfii]PWI22641.1 phosphatase [Kurthia zopfii]TDR39257.1 acyl-CoA synthetase (AMP-forming)/AMP-acid ligase II [Kurthia zopfii]STX08802.1 Short-chain-fatty-acid--CoA ligase [Kurthia zopfii]